MKKSNQCPLLERVAADYLKDFKRDADFDAVDYVSTFLCSTCQETHCFDDSSATIRKRMEKRLVMFYLDQVKERGRLWWQK